MNQKQSIYLGAMWWVPLILVLLGIDLASKLYAQQQAWYSLSVIPELLSLQLTFNSGIAFGFFSDSQAWFKSVLIAGSLFAVGYFFYWLLKDGKDKIVGFSLSLLIAGAMGNLFERITVGVVTDFLHLHIYSYSLFIFNLADFYISIGFIMLIFHQVFMDRSEDKERAHL